MEPIKLGRYRHFKGREYELLFVATHSETLEPMVVYRALYGERGLRERPAAKWDEQIGMMEMVLNVDALADAVRKMREANSKYPL